ncbi:hypothetical protein MPSEU_001030600 [Mayamaea pseudoterrestris]|nr:hypothetical protein MPSEU_001030600 [Mayamaea pseudoterrestris]
MSLEDDDIDDSDKGERKRQREKQRRTDLASAFEELQLTLTIVDPTGSRCNRATSADGDAGAPFTRLDLIRKSTESLKRIHNENQELRRIVNSKAIDAPQPMLAASSWAPELGHSHGYQGQHAAPNYFQGYHYQQNPFYRGYNPHTTSQLTAGEAGYTGYTEGWDGNSQMPPLQLPHYEAHSGTHQPHMEPPSPLTRSSAARTDKDRD